MREKGFGRNCGGSWSGVCRGVRSIAVEKCLQPATNGKSGPLGSWDPNRIRHPKWHEDRTYAGQIHLCYPTLK